MAAEDSPLPHPTVTEPSEKDTDPWIGRSVASYKLVRRIGWGGMGVVYLARHPNLDRDAAVKFLAAHLVMDKTYIDMFVREAKAAAKLNHPNIVAIYDCGSIAGEVYYLIMEYVEGKDLRTILREREVIPVPEAVHYIRQTAAGLGYAHRKKIIHRDIKPENLMLTDENIIKIGDLGLAKWMGDESAQLTQSGMVMGSPFYIAPERLRGEPDINESTDVYSLGGTFFHLVTGKAPYDGTAPVVMAKHLDSAVSDPRDLNPAIDSRLAEIIKKMMAKDQRDRYSMMDELDRDLAEYETSLSHPVMKALPGRMESSSTMAVPEDARKGSKPEIQNSTVVGEHEEDVPTVIIRQPGAAKKSGAWWAITIGVVLIAAIVLVVPLFNKKSGEEPPATATPAARPVVEPPVLAAKPAVVASAKPADKPKPAVKPKPEPSPDPNQPYIISNFEEGTEGWKIDWGFNMGGPTLAPEASHLGSKSVAFRHYFKKDEESAAGVVVLEKPLDLHLFKEVSGWVFLPEGQNTQWQLQMYVRSGKDNHTDWGKVYRAWIGGWHQIRVPLGKAENASQVREVGIQVKCPSDFRATIYFDQVEALPR